MVVTLEPQQVEDSEEDHSTQHDDDERRHQRVVNNPRVLAFVRSVVLGIAPHGAGIENVITQEPEASRAISTGLINQNYWKNSKWYYVNVERGNAADKLNGRNINISFTNKSNVPVEVMVFVFYSDEISIDVKAGLVTRHKN